MNKKKVSIIYKPDKLIFRGCLVFYIKYFLRRALGIKRGPDVVLSSLIRGLNLHTNEISYNINPRAKDLAEVVHVLWNPEALIWAINQKKKGVIKKLIAGPNISILPTMDGRVLCDQEIDIILQPSQWTKQAYTTSCPEISEKIKIWPAGVEIPELKPETDSSKENISNNKKDTYILFKKDFPDDTFKTILSQLEQSDVQIKIMTYGSFKQNEYFEALRNAKGMIYLQKVESQGIALQEAWARNVPTLVWYSGQFTYPDSFPSITVTGNINAPYLTDACGYFFDNVDDFSYKFNEFRHNIDKFTAREYCIEHLSDSISAQKYIEYI